MTTDAYDQLQAAVAFIRERAGGRAPKVGLVLGSGLGPFANRLENAVAIDYSDIPHYPVSGVEGHAGRLIIGELEGTPCVAMQGRVHYYEGHDMRRVTFPTRAMILLGAQTLIITNAAGGMGEGLVPGTLMLIRDHLNLFPDHPLRGPNDDRLGPRFPDMTRAYSPELRTLAQSAAATAGLSAPLPEGVYAGLPGPAYETPAEIRMLQRMGADAAGMSTVPEVIVANHMGAKVLGISCITNLAAGLSQNALSHDEVTETAARVQSQFEALLANILRALGDA